jgi:hypothetical protein
VFIGRSSRSLRIVLNDYYLDPRRLGVKIFDRALTMIIGIEEFRDPQELRLDRMLTQPLRGQVGAYPSVARQL